MNHLAQLQDRCPPLDLETVEDVVQSELGRSIPEIFSDFEAEPAGAGVAQMHRRAPRDGFMPRRAPRAGDVISAASR